MINRHTLSPLIVGKGIEIGAYHNPWPTKAQVTYIDKQPYDKLIEMRNADPNLGPSKPIARVDIVDDGQHLTKIEDNSQDFVLSSHQLEHCICPVTAVENHIRVLKKGGQVFYAVPDMRFTFDRDRTPSYYNLLIRIYLEKLYNDKNMVVNLFREYYRDVDKIPEDKLQEKAEFSYANNHDVHFHCWNAFGFVELISRLADRFMFDIELFSRAGHENFVVLRKE